MAKKKYYAVKVGMTPGIYESWAECENNVKGYPKAEYKGFATLEEAKQYMDGESVPTQDKDTRTKQDNKSSKLGRSDNMERVIDINNASYIGQDEVGKGEPFRRIIVVAAYLDGNHMDEFKEIGATNDSKNYGLDTDKCIKIGKELTDFTHFTDCKNGVYKNVKLGLTYSVYSIDNGYYNELHDKTDKLSADKILAIMHNRAGYNLCNNLIKDEIRIKDVIIDNFISSSNADKNYAKYVAKEKYRLDISGVTMHYETKSEKKYPAVAVAANIANYIEALYVSYVRDSIRDKGGDLDAHGFSNGIDDVQYAFDEIVRIYGSLDNPDIEEEFKHTVYYENYLKCGKVSQRS
ncbi:MAG: ribonuclease H family protein [Lachnospiraceae bacterium]|nr:ribonuclease H family protein [Lachnospiraceae bacterium]